MADLYESLWLRGMQVRWPKTLMARVLGHVVRYASTARLRDGLLVRSIRAISANRTALE